jgi:hypothetical protein
MIICSKINLRQVADCEALQLPIVIMTISLLVRQTYGINL